MEYTMRKLLLLILVLLILPIKTLCANIMPQYVTLESDKTFGLYQLPSEVVLYQEPDESSVILHSISWLGSKIFPDSINVNDLFVVLCSSKKLGLSAVSDETEGWVQIIYNNKTGDKGWIKNEDPYRFMSWVMFYNMYGKKYGLNMLKEIPDSAKDIHVATDDKSQIVGTINLPQKINLTAIKGNWALVSVFDIDKVPKTGYVRWRSDEGVRYYFPAIK